MNPALITTLLQLLQTLGPVVADAVNTIRSNGGASPEDLAKWDAMIEDLDTKRMASWSAADDALAPAP